MFRIAIFGLSIVFSLLQCSLLLADSSSQSHLASPTFDVSEMTAEEALNIGNELANARQWEQCILAFKRAAELVRFIRHALYLCNNLRQVPSSPVPLNNAANAYDAPLPGCFYVTFWTGMCPCIVMVKQKKQSRRALQSPGME